MNKHHNLKRTQFMHINSMTPLKDVQLLHSPDRNHPNEHMQNDQVEH